MFTKVGLYCYGRQFGLVINHKQIVFIFNPHRRLSSMSATQSFTYSLVLSAFNYKIQFKRTSEYWSAESLTGFLIDLGIKRFESSRYLSNKSAFLQMNIGITSYPVIRFYTKNNYVIPYIIISNCKCNILHFYILKHFSVTFGHGQVIWSCDFNSLFCRFIYWEIQQSGQYKKTFPINQMGQLSYKIK